MNYIYDILLNLQDQAYDFYDWNSDDAIDHIRKIPLYRVDGKTLYELKNYQFVLDVEEMNQIKDRTEVFNQKGVEKISYAFLASDGIEVIGFECNHQGRVIGKSKLLIDEEAEVIEVVERTLEREINYQKLVQEEQDPFKTRKELEIQNYIHHELISLKEDNIEKLKYLYYECFNKKSNNRKEIMMSLEKSLQEDWNDTYPKIYSFLKLTGVKEK